MNFFKNISFCHFVETTHSTNLLLNEMVEQEDESLFHDFFCVVSDFQTAGKGQGEKIWQSIKGENLLVSFYFQPDIFPSQQIYFNYFFSLTIREVISMYVTHVYIKKPNDIWVGDKKIAGILIEHHIQGEKLKYTIAGVGININQIQFDPALPNPTSLKLLTGKNFCREIILEDIIQIGRKFFNKLQAEAFFELENEYESYNIIQ